MRLPDEKNDIERVLFSEEELQARVEALGKALTQAFAEQNPIVVCVLKGASVFFADLCRQIKCPIEFDFLCVSSYGAQAKSCGEVTLKKDLDCDVRSRHVILVEDIVDSGLTLAHLKALFSDRGAASVTTVCLLDKVKSHAPSLACDYVGFSIENEFVVGYGLDYAQQYRNLPYIGVLKAQVYAE
jgi:hypoxanthine phosphoribosyltransferase